MPFFPLRNLKDYISFPNPACVIKATVEVWDPGNGRIIIMMHLSVMNNLRLN